MSFLRNFARTEAGKLREMSFAEKRQYIWEYYKLHIAGLVIAIAVIGSMLNTLVFNPPRQEYVYFAWVGPFVTLQSLDDFVEELAVIVENPDRYEVRAGNYGMHDVDPQAIMGLQTRFVANLQFGSFDMFMVSTEEITDFAISGFILPILPLMEVVRTKNPVLYSVLRPRLVLLTFIPEGYEDEQTVYMAIDLAGVGFLERIDIYTEGLFMSVAVNSHRFERVVRALEVIFDEE